MSKLSSRRGSAPCQQSQEPNQQSQEPSQQSQEPSQQSQEPIQQQLCQQSQQQQSQQQLSQQSQQQLSQQSQQKQSQQSQQQLSQQSQQQLSQQSQQQFSQQSQESSGKPSPNDSGVNIQMLELADGNYTETDKMLDSNHSSPDSDVPIHINMEIRDELENDSSNSVSCGCLLIIAKVHRAIRAYVTTHSSLLGQMLKGVLVVALLVYFLTSLGFAALHFCPDDHDVTPLVALTCVSLFLVVTSYAWSKFGDTIQEKLLVPLHKGIDNQWKILRWVGAVLPLAGVVAVVMSTVWSHPQNLISLGGFFFFVILLFVCSSAPIKVHWRPVIGGFILQFYIATLILQWDVGYRAFSFLGEEARKFMSYTDAGSKFVFGQKFTDHIFVMQVLPVVVFFSCVITMLYHLGVMQSIISKIALVMHCTLGTTAAESLCAAGNIFVGQTEAPILIRPFLAVMTKSELHAVMVGGFATIAGGVLAAYIKFGIPPEHLLCASVMNAPCSLAVSKLLCPETEKSKISKTNAMVDEKGHFRNLLEAAAAGASQSIALVANIAANLIAFLALLAFVNSTIAWFGAFVCLPGLSFESICHYLLMPVVYLMGVRWEDAGQVAELIALKTFLNEFVAYEKLSEFIDNRVNCLTDGHILSPRSEMIATYALCGFSNLSSIGITLGGLGSMAPNRISDMASVVVSALFGGIVACLITATIAGLLVAEVSTDALLCVGNWTLINNTSLALDLLTHNATTVATGTVLLSSALTTTATVSL